jgi:hypothetical protein
LVRLNAKDVPKESPPDKPSKASARKK